LSRSIQVLALVFGNGINVFLGFLLVPYLSRSLSVSDYGTYGQVLMVIGFLVSVLGFGLDKVLYADLADENIDSNNTIISNAANSFLFGIGGTIIVLFCNNWIASYLDNELLSNLLLVFAISIPFQLLYKSFTSTLVYYGLVKKSVVINVTTNILRLVLIFIFVQLYYSLFLIFLSLVLIPVLQSAFAYLSIPHVYKINGKIKKDLMVNQVNIGIPLGLTVIISTVFQMTDGFMVSRLLGVESYAIFRNGATEIPMLAGIYASVNTILLPDVSKMFANGKILEIAKLKSRALLNTAALIYPLILFFIIFSFELIPLYLSQKYASSYVVFMIFNSVLFLRVTSYTDVYIASKKNNLLPKKFLIVSLVNLVLNYFLIDFFNVKGAALATFLSYLLLITLLIKDSLKILKIRLRDLIPFRKMLVLFFGCLVFCLLIRETYLQLNNIFYLPFLGIGFALTTYFVILNYDLLEKEIVRNILKKSKLLSPVLYFFNRIFPISNL